MAAAAPGALAVAGAYATQALSSTWHEAPDAWVGRVAPLCTPEWLAVLRAPSADGGGATWAAVLASRATATAQVLGTYPGAGPGQRLYVRAALDVTAEHPPGQPGTRRPITMVVDATEYRLGHLSAFVAADGDSVDAGDVIALSGNSGDSTGPHVHLEVRPGGGPPVDPAPYLGLGPT